jgi:TatA/E family protein of Tat protein translocase
MFNLGPLELLAILVVALLVFGPDKLPEIGKQVGKAMREFKQFQAHIHEQARDVIEPITGPMMSGGGPLSGGNGPRPTNISGGPIPTDNNVPRSATIQNPEPPSGEAEPPGTYGHYAPVEPPTTGTGEVLSGPAPATPPSPTTPPAPAGAGETSGGHTPTGSGETAPPAASPEPDGR